MARGVRDLRQIQIGFQTPAYPGAGWDTCVAPTERVVGQCGMKKLVNRVFPTEATGVMSDHIIDRFYDPWVMAELPMTPGDEGLTYEQFILFLAMGVEAGVVGVAGVTDYTWTYQPAWTTADVPEVSTIRYGDNAGVWEVCSCFARNLVISAAFQGPWQIEADIIGRDMETAAFENIAYPDPLETILGQLTSFYLDTSCANLGNTQVEGSLIDWRVTVPGFHPKFFQDGILTYSVPGLASRHLTFEATVEWDSVFAAAEHAAWIAGTPRYVRLQALGSLIGLVPHTATIDMVIMYESFETLEERDGNDIIKFTARTVYDVACAAMEEWEIEVINTVVALP